MSERIDTDRVVAELAAGWVDRLPGAQRAEAEDLLAEVVALWAQEAEGTPDAEAVVTVQRNDLEAAWAKQDPAGRLETLGIEVLRRQVDRLGGQTYALGVAILDGSVSDEEAQRRGRELLDGAERLGPRVRELPQSPQTMPIRRELGDAMMEALFAVERKAMSARLDRERQSRASR